jgi:very-short-patch-repair endonuclease
MAAVLTREKGALLSHRSAAALWGIGPAASPRVDVTLPSQSGNSPPGIALHRVRSLDPDDQAVRHGIPVTSIPRTLLDLAEVVDRARLERAFEEAERLGLLDLRAVEQLCERSRGRHGLRPLLTLLPSLSPPPETRSELERQFVAFCREAGLPTPVMNAQVAGFEVDALWPRAGLVVELDGYAFHGTRAAFERDRARDAALQVAGYRVLRLTHRRLTTEPATVEQLIRPLLDRPRQGR